MRWMTLLVLSLFTAQDSAEIGRLVESLGSESPNIREEAENRLIDSGPAALPALRKSESASDSEVRVRVKAVIQEIERLERDHQQDLAERARLLSINRKEEDAKKEKEASHGDVSLGGARLSFLVRRFGGGISVETFVTDYLMGFPGGVSFDVVGVADKEGKALAIERCGRCSPKIIYVKDSAGPVRLHLQGVQLWFSPHVVEFKDPQNGDRKKCGEFTFEVKWPALKATSRRAWPNEVLAQVGTGFKYEVKPGTLFPPVFGGIGLSGGGGRYGGKKKGWCYCDDGPQPVAEKAKREVTKEIQIRNGGDVTHELAQVSRIEYTFKRPIEEPFDITAELSGDK